MVESLSVLVVVGIRVDVVLIGVLENVLNQALFAFLLSCVLFVEFLAVVQQYLLVKHVFI